MAAFDLREPHTEINTTAQRVKCCSTPPMETTPHISRCSILHTQREIFKRIVLKSGNWPAQKHELISKYLKIILTVYKVDKFLYTVRDLDSIYQLIYLNYYKDFTNCTPPVFRCSKYCKCKCKGNPLIIQVTAFPMMKKLPKCTMKHVVLHSSNGACLNKSLLKKKAITSHPCGG